MFFGRVGITAVDHNALVGYRLAVCQLTNAGLRVRRGPICAKTAQRKATNAKAKGSRPGKVAKLEGQAAEARKAATANESAVNNRAAATGAAAGGGANPVLTAFTLPGDRRE